MLAQQIAPGLFELPLQIVNVFLISTTDGLILIDAGIPQQSHTILNAVQELGRQPTDIRHIIVTHAHPDHIGSLAELKQATQATVYAHTIDTPIVQAGSGFRPLTPAPGILTGLLFRMFIRPAPDLLGTTVDQELEGGSVLPLANGLHIMHTPGHSAGHIALYWPSQRVIFAGDTCSNMFGLGWSLGYEDLDIGRQSLIQLAHLDVDIACFGHGKAIRRDASARLRKRWL